MLPYLAMTGEAHVSVCAALRAGLGSHKGRYGRYENGLPAGCATELTGREDRLRRERALGYPEERWRIPGESGSFRASS